MMNPHVSHVSLRPTTPADLPTLFAQQSDPLSNEMAGTKARTWEVFGTIWEKIFRDQNAFARVIVEDGRVVGGINCFKKGDEDHVGYWIDRSCWGRGLATRGLSLLIGEFKPRPLHATAAKANAASIRVLERCGFRLVGYSMGEETERYLAREVAGFVLE